MALDLSQLGFADSDLRALNKINQEQYEWQLDEDGILWGLVAGDQGYDPTGTKLQTLVYDALAACDDAGLHAELQDKLEELISISIRCLLR